MKGKKLFTLLRSLSQKEWDGLKKAVQSPVFNTNSRVEILYGHLKESYPAFEGKELEPECLFDRLFPGEDYHDYKLRRVLSGLAKVVESYLAYLESIAQPEIQSRFLAKALGRRNLYSLFDQESTARLRALEASPFQDTDYFLEKIGLHWDYYFHPLTQKHTIEAAQLAELDDCIDSWYALTKLRLSSELKNRERIFPEKYDIRSLEAIRAAHEEGLLSNNPLFSAYLKLLDVYQDEGNPQLFRELRTQFFAQIEQFQADGQLMLFQQLINYAIRRINQGESSYYGQLLAMYRQGLEYGLLLDHGRMSEATYSNIVLVGCQEGEFEWTHHFINTYSHYLEESARADAKSHCFILWYYFQKEYEKAMDLLNAYRFTEPFQLRARMTAVRISFEQFISDPSYDELLLYQISAFERYLQRNKQLTREKKVPHANILSLIRRITRELSRGRSAAEMAGEVEQRIESGEPLIIGKWLLSQLKAASKAS